MCLKYCHKKNDKNAFRWTGRFSNFDVVLGNPPYVRQERLSNIKPYLEKHYETYHGVADLYTYFFELGLKILKKDGYLGYISSSTFFKTGSGESLRQHLSIKANLKTIVDFGDLQVFEGVTTYPAILIMSKPTRTRKQAPKDVKLKFWNVVTKKLDDLKTEIQTPKWGTMPQNKLTNDGWRLEDEKLLALRKKITKGKKTLKEVYGSPYYGIKTGRNEAFVINETIKDQLISEDARSLEIIKPFLEGKDLKKWHSEPRNLYIIFTRRGIDIDQYPAIKKYLEGYRKILEPKPKDHPKGKKWTGRKAGAYKWYEIQDTVDYYNEFEKTKIIYNRFMPTSLFWLDDNNTYFNNALNLIPNTSYYELGLLNSNTSWFFLKSIASTMSGGFYQIHGHILERLPIPKTTDKKEEEIAKLAEDCQKLAEDRYEVENDFRLNIPDLCPEDREAKLNNKLKSWWLLSFDDFKKEIKKQFKHTMTSKETKEWRKDFNDDKTEIQSLSSQLATKEQELNTKVYELFNLSEDEIALLEDNI